MLKRIGEYNNIPKELLPKLPAPGTIAEFQYLETIVDMVAKEGKEYRSYPMHRVIPATCTFRATNGDWYPIGMVDQITKDPKTGQESIVSNYSILSREPKKERGVLKIVIGSSSVTDALFQYLLLSDFVKDSPYNNDAVPSSGSYMFRYIDREADARKEIEEDDQRREAESIAIGLEDHQLKEVAYILGIDGNLSPIQVRAQIRAVAKNEYRKFLARVKDESLQYKARFAQALSMEILKFRPDTQFIVWNDASQKELFKVVRSDAEGMQAEYAEFILNTAGAVRYDQVIQDEIRKKIGGEPVKNKPGRKPAEV